MAAPVVIRQGEDPLTNAIQFAGKAIRDSIGLMNQAQQIQVMKDQNRITAGKDLLDVQWNLFDSLTKDLGPEAAWDKTKMGFSSAFKMLDMPEPVIGDFNRAMTSGPISVQGFRIATLNRLALGKGSFGDTPDGFWSELQKQHEQDARDEAVKVEQKAAQPATSGDETVVERGTITKTYDEWVSASPTNPVPSPVARPKPVYDVKAAGPTSPFNQIAAEGAKKQLDLLNGMRAKNQITQEQYNAFVGSDPNLIEKAKQYAPVGPTGQPTTPTLSSGGPTKPQVTPTPAFTTPAPARNGTQSSSAANAPVWVKKERQVQLVGPLPSEVDTPQKAAEWKQKIASSLVESGVSIGIAGMFAEASAVIETTTTKKPRTGAGGVITLGEVVVSASPLTPPVEQGKRSIFPSTPPAGFANVKPYVDDAGTVSDEAAYKGYKSFYEYWAKTQAGVEFKGPDAHLGTNIARYIMDETPDLMSRVSSQMSLNFLGTFDPSGRGDPAAGLQGFQMAMAPDVVKMKVDQVNASANMLQAKAQAAGEAALDKPFSRWDTERIPGLSDKVGQVLSLREYIAATNMTGEYIRAMAAAGVGGKAESATYLQAEKYLMEEDSKMWDSALKQAKGLVASAGVGFERQRTERLAKVDSYFASHKIVNAYRKEMGWSGIAKGADTPLFRSGPLGLIERPAGTMNSSGMMVYPEVNPSEQGGTTQPNTKQVDEYMKNRQGGKP